MQARFLLAVFLCAGCSCGGPAMPPPDGGGLPDGGRADASVVVPCAADTECADIDYCNGTERCLPGDPAADARGCVAGMDPCTTGQTCDEDLERCVDDTCPPDGDGDTITTCEGDCDDTRNDIHPGATEICVLPMLGAVDSTDEDCNPMTFGYVNADGDGAISASCFNVDEATGMRYGGTDCDDGNPSISPLAAEMCDGPDGIDENCNGSRDEGCACSPIGSMETCGIDIGECAMGMRTCLGGAWDACGGPGHVPEQPEVCNHLDDDCDGMLDEAVSSPACTVTRTPTMTRPLFGSPTYNHTCTGTCRFVCTGTCTGDGTFSGRIVLADGASTDGAPGAAYFSTSSAQTIDLGSSTRVTATFAVRAGSSDTGKFGLTLSSSPNNATTGFILAPDGAVSLSAFSQNGWHASVATTGVPGAVLEDAPYLPDGCFPSTAERFYTITLDVSPPTATVSLSTSGCSPVSASTSIPSYDTTFYGLVSPSPRWYVGVLSDDNAGGGFYAALTSLTLERRAAAERGNCIGCPF